MREKASISREIAKVCSIIALITLVISAVVFVFVYLFKNELGYSLTSSLGAGVIVLSILSVTLPVKTADKIAKKTNALNLQSPFTENVYVELEPLRQKAAALKTETNKKLSEMSLEHTKQDNLRRDFTANVSHELKTPLTSIRGYAELIRDGLAKSEDFPRFAEKICDESQRLISLVGDIIKLSQLDGNDIKVKIEELDLFELTRAVIGQLEMAAKEKNVSISLTGDRAVITGGEQIVEEMIFNLIDNAIKYNKDGGEVRLRIKQRVDGVELEVADTGIGIAEEDIPHIFERFWRADKSHSKEIGGTGLGLSIVKHGAMFMDAHILVKSQINVGTTIRILF